jgi:two-component system LytT family response regulator
VSTIRAMIVDDEPLARERIRDLLATDPEVAVEIECADGVEAVDAIREHAPDLLFLDVQMPERDGFDVVAEVGVDAVPAIVFVTAYDRYAVRAFEVHAVDYLLKPFDEERFREAVTRAKRRARRGRDEVDARIRAAIAELRPCYVDRITVRSGERLLLVRAEEIDWIEAEGNYVKLHAGAETHMVRETIGGLEARLDPARFARTHRSTIVNLDRVREIEPTFHGDYRVVLRNGTKLPLSRTYRDRVL